MNDEIEVVTSPAEIKERKALLKQMDKEESEERARTIETSASQVRGRNEAYFLEQERLATEARNNKPTVAPPKTNEQVVAEHVASYPYKKYDPTTDPTHPEFNPQLLKRSVVGKPTPGVLEIGRAHV